MGALEPVEVGSRTDIAGSANESEQNCCASMAGMQTAGRKKERNEPPPAGNGAEPKVQQAESQHPEAATVFAAVPSDPSYVDALANPDAVAGGLCVIRSKSTIQLAEANSEAALVLAQSMSAAGTMWIMTNSEHAGLNGLGRSARAELSTLARALGNVDVLLAST